MYSGLCECNFLCRCRSLGGNEPCKVRGELLCLFFFSFSLDVGLLVCKACSGEELAADTLLRALSTFKPKDLMRTLLCCQYFERFSQHVVFYKHTSLLTDLQR